jgi:alpha-glucosidase
MLPDQTTKAPNNNWWRGGVIYQIYPRSFQDSNNDGVGDLRGITDRLEYLANLGVDGIWLSPFFKSPMKDFGYDVSDYCDVDPLFGTLDDFSQLLQKAHDLGLKVMIDQVLSHTSDQHPWFVESRSSKNNAKSDWYVWADAKQDGTPPNNWQSHFGGSAWQWDTKRCQYYFHNFLSSQPDLNFHHPEVRAAILESVKFWLDMGVDGYRLDTVCLYFHDSELRDNPARGRPRGNNADPGLNAFNPYAYQWHIYDKSRPENLDFLKELRSLLDQYPNTTMVGEIGDDDGLARMAEYTAGGDKLHMAYCFDLMGQNHDAPYIHALLSRFLKIVGDGWPCWALSNHDVMRVATRWGGTNPDSRIIQAASALLLCLRGSVCLYQGDELGLPEAQLAFEDLQDPYGIAMWPEYKGRDGCRTPMVWNDQAHAGFSQHKPWLPVPNEHKSLNVEKQQSDSSSHLSFHTRFLHWRKQQPALIDGLQRMLPIHDQILAFERRHPMQSIVCAFNCSDQPAIWTNEIQDNLTDNVINAQGVKVQSNSIHFEPWGWALFAIPT